MRKHLWLVAATAALSVGAGMAWGQPDTSLTKRVAVWTLEALAEVLRVATWLISLGFAAVFIFVLRENRRAARRREICPPVISAFEKTGRWDSPEIERLVGEVLGKIPANDRLFAVFASRKGAFAATSPSGLSFFGESVAGGKWTMSSGPVKFALNLKKETPKWAMQKSVSPSPRKQGFRIPGLRHRNAAHQYFYDDYWFVDRLVDEASGRELLPRLHGKVRDFLEKHGDGGPYGTPPRPLERELERRMVSMGGIPPEGGFAEGWGSGDDVDDPPIVWVVGFSGDPEPSWPAPRNFRAGRFALCSVPSLLVEKFESQSASPEDIVAMFSVFARASLAWVDK